MYQYAWVKAKSAYLVCLSKGGGLTHAVGYVWQFGGKWYAHPDLVRVDEIPVLKAPTQEGAAALLNAKTARKLAA